MKWLLRNFSRIFFTLSLFCWFVFLTSFFKQSFYYPSFNKEASITFYPSDCGYDLKQIFCHEIQNAKKSIDLASFGIFDRDIIRHIEQKQKEGLTIAISDDPKQPKSQLKSLKPYLKEYKLKGLFHRKWLIIDQKLLFLGSTNCTPSSFLLHDNLLASIKHKKLIKAIHQDEFFQDALFTYYPLPKYAPKALDHLIDLIKQSHNSIEVIMYTLTHPKLIDALIFAKSRGIKVHIFLDKSMALGTCKTACQKLKQAGIPIRVNVKSALIHHKIAKIDDQIVFGSTNWTQAGFGKNEEILLICRPKNQQLYNINRLFQMSKKRSRIL